MPANTLEISQHAAPMPTRMFGWAMMLCSTFAFSLSSPLATTLIRQGVDPTTMLVARFAITLVLMAAAIAFAAPARFVMPPRSLAVALGAGLINSISMLCFFWSLTRLSTSIASMLFSLYPLALLGLLALRGERFTQRHFVRLALGIGGAYLLIDPGGSSDTLGVLLVLCTGAMVPASRGRAVRHLLQRARHRLGHLCVLDLAGDSMVRTNGHRLAVAGGDGGGHHILCAPGTVQRGARDGQLANGSADPAGDAAECAVVGTFSGGPAAAAAAGRWNLDCDQRRAGRATLAARPLAGTLAAVGPRVSALPVAL